MVAIQGDKNNKAAKRNGPVIRGACCWGLLLGLLLFHYFLEGFFSGQFLVGETDDSGPLIEVKGLNDIRPQLEDDSLTCPLSGRRCGEGLQLPVLSITECSVLFLMKPTPYTCFR